MEPPPEPECKCFHTWSQHVCHKLASGDTVTRCIEDTHLWSWLSDNPDDVIGACPGECDNHFSVCNHCDAQEDKELWCHRPKGNPENAQTLCLPLAAWTEFPEGHPASHDCGNPAHSLDGATPESCTPGPCEEDCTDVPTVKPHLVCQHRPKHYPGYCVAYFTYKTEGLAHGDWVSIKPSSAGNRWMSTQGTGLPKRFWHHSHHGHVEPWDSDSWLSGFKHGWDGSANPWDVTWSGWGHDTDGWTDGWESGDEGWESDDEGNWDDGSLDWGDTTFDGEKPAHHSGHYVFVWKCARNKDDWEWPRERSWWVHSPYGKYHPDDWQTSWEPRWHHLEAPWWLNDCPVGECDGKLWSNKTEDACGVCGGTTTDPAECTDACNDECGPCDECHPRYKDLWGNWHEAECKPKPCAGATACEEGVCNAESGNCTSVPNRALCRDKNPCTRDRCVVDHGATDGYKCRNPEKMCPAGDCMEATCADGVCPNATAIVCDQPADKCLESACSGPLGCQEYKKSCSTSNQCLVELPCESAWGCRYEKRICPDLPCKRLLGCYDDTGCKYVDLVDDHTDPCLDVSCTAETGLVIKEVTCNDNDTCTTDKCMAGKCVNWKIDQCCTETEDCIPLDDNNCEIAVCNTEISRCEVKPLPIPHCCKTVHDCFTPDSCVADDCVAGQCMHTDLRANCTEDDLCYNYGCDYRIGFPDGCFKVPKSDPNPIDLCAPSKCDADTGIFTPVPTLCLDDPNPCNAPGMCNPATGKCWYDIVNATACDDENACTPDRCENNNGEKVCYNPEKDCGDDESFCWLSECTNTVTGDCGLTKRKCPPPPDACHRYKCVDFHYGGGECVLEEIPCVTDDPCRPRACDGELGCVELPNPCQPRTKCEQATCRPKDNWYHYYGNDEPAFTCEYDNVTCFRGNKCENGECNLNTGVCDYLPEICLAPYNCTFGTCNQWTGCEFSYVKCETGSPCKPATCAMDTNVCEPDPPECEPRHACEDVYCHPEIGSCKRSNRTSCCLSDDECHTSARCASATCDLATNTCKDVPQLACCRDNGDCDDGDACTKSLCRKDGTCDNTPKEPPAVDACHRAVCESNWGYRIVNITKCVDGDPCTHDICEDHYGEAVCRNPEIVCEAGRDACHPNKCSRDTGICEPDDVKCDDENPCTREWCEDHYGLPVCVGLNRTCFEGEFYRKGECNPDTGLCEPEETCPTDDGLACTWLGWDEEKDVCVSRNVTCPQSANKCLVCRCDERIDDCVCDDIPLPPITDRCNIPECDPLTGETTYWRMNCTDPTDACNTGTCRDGVCGDWKRKDCSDDSICLENFCKDVNGTATCMDDEDAGCCETPMDCPVRACHNAVCDDRSHTCRYEQIAECCSTDDQCTGANLCDQFACLENKCEHVSTTKCPPAKDKCHAQKCLPKTGVCVEKETLCYSLETCKYSECSLDDGKCYPHDYTSTCDDECDWGHCSPHSGQWLCEPMADSCPVAPYGYYSYVDDECHCQTKHTQCKPHPTDKCVDAYFDYVLGKCHWKPKPAPSGDDACHYYKCYADKGWVEHEHTCEYTGSDDSLEGYCHPYIGCDTRDRCPDHGPCTYTHWDSEQGRCIYGNVTCDALNAGALVALDAARTAGVGVCSVRTDYICLPGYGTCAPTNAQSECCENDGDCDDGVASTTDTCVENRCQYADVICESANSCFVSVASPVSGLCEETRTEVCEANESMFDRLGDWFGLAPGSPWRVIIPIIAAVVLIGGIVGCFFAFRPRRGSSGDDNMRIGSDEGERLVGAQEKQKYYTQEETPRHADGIRQRGGRPHIATKGVADTLSRNVWG